MTECMIPEYADSPEKARRSGKLQKAIRHGTITAEEAGTLAK